MAMEAEAAPLVAKTGVKPISSPDPRLPFRYFQGDFNGLDLLLGLNGKDAKQGVDNIGTEPSALNAYTMIRSFEPDLLINAGTAGGFRRHGARIGDVYLSADAFRYHDHRIPIPGFDQYGLGNHPTLDVSELAQRLGLKTGVVTTGNSLDYTDACIRVMAENDARVKEMEAAAIAWVADLLKTPFFAIKSVTDIVDGEHPAAEEFLRNLALASANLADAVLRVIELLSTETAPFRQ